MGWPWFPWSSWVPEVLGPHKRCQFAGPIRGLLGLFMFACAVRPANVNKPSKQGARPANGRQGQRTRGKASEMRSGRVKWVVAHRASDVGVNGDRESLLGLFGERLYVDSAEARLVGVAADAVDEAAVAGVDLGLV